MIRLLKGGMVRIVETAAEAERFIRQGYYIEETSETEILPNPKLMAKTVSQLTELCTAKSITVPANAKKQDLVSLLSESLSPEELEELS